VFTSLAMVPIMDHMNLVYILILLLHFHFNIINSSKLTPRMWSLPPGLMFYMHFWFESG